MSNDGWRPRRRRPSKRPDTTDRRPGSGGQFGCRGKRQGWLSREEPWTALARVDFAAKHRLPALYQAVLSAEAGGLMTWAPDQNEQMRVAVRMMDKVLRGVKPGNLPIVYPERYFLTLNRTAAHQIGLTFPERLLAKADRVID